MRSYHRFLSIILAVLLALPLPALARHGRHRTEAPVSTGTTSSVLPVDLNLKSARRAYNAANIIGDGAVAIQAGRAVRTVTSQSLLTPAEIVAVYQVVNYGQQLLQLNQAGKAVGGTVNLASLLTQSVNNVIIPRGVTVIRDVATESSLTIAGNLINWGSIYAVSSSPQVSIANISATNIFNRAGGLLTTVLPSAGLPGYANLLASLNLSITALQDIINQGVISSSGGLYAVAGRSIVNTMPIGVTGPAPIIQAVNDVNLQALNIVNQGQISALVGNVTVTAATVQNQGIIQSFNANVIVNNLLANLLAVNNILGTIAARDTITFQTRDATQLAAAAGKPGISFTGGTLAADTIRFLSPGGTVSVLADRLQGKVEATAASASIGSRVGELWLGKVNITGDPTFYALGGDFIITEPLIFPGEPLAIVASGDILAGKGAGIIDTSSPAGPGGPITLIAGVEFSADGSEPPKLTITGPSATGGQIDLETSKAIITTMSSSGGGAAGSGGDILMIAFAGSDAHSGEINVPTSGLTITSGGSGTGTSGNVTIIGGSDITLGSVDTRGGSGTGGNVSISSIQPVLKGGAPVIIEGSKITSGEIIPDPAKASGGEVTIYEGSAIRAKQDVSITGYGNVEVSKTSNQPPYNVIIEAGELKPGADITKPLNPEDIVHKGGIYITSITGNVTAKRAVSMQAVGGDLGITADLDIRFESNADLKALGSYLYFGANGDVEIAQESSLYSVAQLTGEPCEWCGGGIAIYTGFPGLDLVADVLVPRKDRTVYPPGYYPSGDGLKIDDFSTFEAIKQGRIDLTAYAPDFLHVWKSQFVAEG
ncbi:MAG TPA: hypothetical protein V6D08_10960, partial [Candidatus Obscuribacterales bacterium]